MEVCGLSARSKLSSSSPSGSPGLAPTSTTATSGRLSSHSSSSSAASDTCPATVNSLEVLRHAARASRKSRLAQQIAMRNDTTVSVVPDRVVWHHPLKGFTSLKCSLSPACRIHSGKPKQVNHFEVAGGGTGQRRPPARLDRQVGVGVAL